MRVFHSKSKLREHLGEMEPGICSIGLVPTMGALHPGHVTLVRQAVLENCLIVVSIFVNPTQFNNPEDLRKYPKTLQSDLVLLESIPGQIVVFAPSVEEMYPDDVASGTYQFDGMEASMEGKYREGHFDGVATVVEKLFRIVEPEKAYFGEKDFQQLQIIRNLVQKLQLPVEIIGCPIVREPNGLAMSSRNERLSPAGRKEAATIYKTLLLAKEKFAKESVSRVTGWVSRRIREHPLLRLEYFEIVNPYTLSPVKRKRKDGSYRAFIAVYVEGVRLIDNLAL